MATNGEAAILCSSSLLVLASFLRNFEFILPIDLLPFCAL